MQIQIIAEIETYSTAFTNFLPATGVWASTFLPIIANIPNPSPSSVNFLTGESDFGGFTLDLTEAHEIFDDLNVNPVTLLSSNFYDGQTTMDLVDASTLASSGIVFVGKEAIAYSGKSSNSLTGCTRGVRGSTEVNHFANAPVYSSPTGLFGKRIFLRWKAPGESLWLRSVGLVDSLEWSGGLYRLTITSPQVYLREGQIFSYNFKKIKGRMVSPGQSDEGVLFTLDGTRDEATEFISLLQQTNPRWGIGMKSPSGSVFPLLQTLVYPAFQKEITSWTSGSRLAIWDMNQPADGVLENGDFVEILDSSDALEISNLFVRQKLQNVSAAYLSGDTTAYSWTSGDQLTTPFKFAYFFPSGTTGLKTLGEDEEFTEVAFMTGNLITDVILPLLFSTGEGTNGAYDILPEGWGLGWPTEYVETAVLEALSVLFPESRSYYFSKSESFWDLISKSGISAGVIFFFSNEGKFTGKKLADLFPNSESVLSIGESRLAHKQIPALTSGYNQVVNSFVFNTDWNPSTESFESQTIVNDISSISRYGRRVHEISDRGIKKGGGINSLGLKVLKFFSLPFPRLTIQIRFAYGDAFEIGDFVSLTLKHLPTMRGTKGFNPSLFRVESISLNDSEGHWELVLAGLQVSRTALISPAGVISSVSSNDIVLVSSATTLFAPTSYSASIPIHDGTGTQDSDWFEVGDKITLWDKSTLGSATPTTSDHEITAINHGTRTITLNGTVPGWAQAGDLFRFSKTATWSGATTLADRQDIYAALATILLSGFEPYIWGV